MVVWIASGEEFLAGWAVSPFILCLSKMKNVPLDSIAVTNFGEAQQKSGVSTEVIRRGIWVLSGHPKYAPGQLSVAIAKFTAALWRDDSAQDHGCALPIALNFLPPRRIRPANLIESPGVALLGRRCTLFA